MTDEQPAPRYWGIRQTAPPPGTVCDLCGQPATPPARLFTLTTDEETPDAQERLFMHPACTLALSESLRAAVQDAAPETFAASVLPRRVPNAPVAPAPPGTALDADAEERTPHD